MSDLRPRTGGEWANQIYSWGGDDLPTLEHQWRVVKKMYESPIEIIQGEMQTEYENGILRALQKYDIHCNKEELTKALAYDRDQYRKGFEDGRPKWIPCSERLPEPRVDVWVCSDIGQIQGYYEEHIDTWYASFGQGRDYLELIVTAWMPLPEPYKEEAE